MAEVYANGARGRLNADITNVATTLTLRSGQGSLFPSWAGVDYSWGLIEEGPAGNPTKREYVQFTNRSGDTLTLTRAQQGSSALAFSKGARVSLPITAETFRAFQQARGYNRSFTTSGVQPEGTATVDGYGPMINGAAVSTFTRPVPSLGGGIGPSIPRMLGTRFCANASPTQNIIGTAGQAPNLGGLEFLYRGPLEEDLSSTRKLIGVSNSATTTLIDATEPSALSTVHMVAVGYDSTVATGGNWQVFTNAGGTVLVTSTGIARVVGHMYQIRIWSPRGVAKWCVEFTDLSIGSRYFGEFTSNVPVCGTALYATLHTFRSGGSATFSIQGMWSFLPW